MELSKAVKYVLKYPQWKTKLVVRFLLTMMTFIGFFYKLDVSQT